MIKIDLEHNISDLKIPELRVDPKMTLLALKDQVEKRYGSEPNYVRFTLKTKKDEVVTEMEEEFRTLDFYGVKEGMVIRVTDLNPNSIHNEISNTGLIEKYVMSEETYEKRSDTFRKWKHAYLIDNPHAIHSAGGKPEISDPEYMKELSETMSVYMRCRMEDGSKGTIRYIGKVPSLGVGYFVGIELDEVLEGEGDGTIEGFHYFYCDIGKGIFARPNKLEIGEFPKIEEDDEI